MRVYKSNVHEDVVGELYAWLLHESVVTRVNLYT